MTLVYSNEFRIDLSWLDSLSCDLQKHFKNIRSYECLATSDTQDNHLYLALGQQIELPIRDTIAQVICYKTNFFKLLSLYTSTLLSKVDLSSENYSPWKPLRIDCTKTIDYFVDMTSHCQRQILTSKKCKSWPLYNLSVDVTEKNTFLYS